MMKLNQAWSSIFPQHKYEINSALLGDPRVQAWSNLGYWMELEHEENQGRESSYTHDQTTYYIQACQRLAEKLALQIGLKEQDDLLDLGCGKGASLHLWRQRFHVKHIEAIELQPKSVEFIQKLQIPNLSIHCGSFLNLEKIPFSRKFDVILCVDAAYHHDISIFISSITQVLNPQGRIAFHHLVLTAQFWKLSTLQQYKYRYLLKAADVNLQQLRTEEQIHALLQDADYEKISVQNISAAVLSGFSKYAETLSFEHAKGLDAFKIKMTAKLCAQLYADGIVEYVQISAQKRFLIQCDVFLEY